MNTMNRFGSAISVLAVLLLSACGTMNNPNAENSYPQSTNSNGAYSGYGVVKSIDIVRQDTAVNNDIGLGTVAGAVVGGLVGSQIGGGRGNTVATVAGVAGGAYAGHQLEKRGAQQSEAYRITIRMDSGDYQTLLQSTNANLRVGDRVQIDNGAVRRY